MSQTPNRFSHIVLFKILPGIDQITLNKALVLLKDLGVGHEGLIKWHIELSTDTRKGQVIIENSLFTDEDSFHEFQNSSIHKVAGDFMKRIADWITGDYLED